MFRTLANPQAFMRWSAWAAPLAGALAAALFAIGLPWALIFSPPDRLHNEMVRIMYVHVPAAWWAMAIYAFMTVASVTFLVWRHALADLAAKAAAPIGAAFSGLCLITGALWGSRAWGAWWAWEARLTAMLILFLFYLGYLAVRAAVEDEEKAGALSAIVCLAGFINLPIIHFSVDWWTTLHQTSSFFRREEEKPGIDSAMLGPLFVMAGAYAATAASLALFTVRAAIYKKRVRVAQQRRLRTA